MNLMKSIFVLMIMLFIFWGVSSFSWFMLWMSLEMSMLMMIPLMTMLNSQHHIESAMKYFLIQGISSSSFILISLWNIMNFLFIPSLMIIVVIMMKIGMFPFMFWYKEVIMKSSFLSNKLIMTLQKILPMTVIYYLMKVNMNYFIYILIFMNSLFSSIMAYNETMIKKIMALSSINNMSWMVLSVSLNFSLFLIFLLVYSNIIIYILNMMNLKNLVSLTQMFKFNNLLLNINILSMAGLPPFSGFMLKWLMLSMMLNMNLVLFSVIMVITSLLSLYFYLRMVLMSSVMMVFSMKWLSLLSSKKEMMYFMNLKSMLNLFFIPFMMVIYSF
uniref:NADH-ubiquinone oxidoreductase chain 2 n=1 Tax=Tanystylum orbiculare TaxID=88027 RepID=E0XLE0_TANOR|nr:NADH dehydrogenase subunit 2 [Tanystylum orbiculare]ADB91985.1 NADH dehydrogenase subunit 2 [Tanystylum orbiculare]